MEQALADHYFWATALYILGGIVAYVAGFLTCFFFFNYTIVPQGEEVKRSQELQETGFWTNLLKRHEEVKDE